MKQLLTLLFFIFIPKASAIPVVPNFTQGSMTSHTETTSKVTETINSMDYATGWQYTVTGTNVDHSGSTISPTSTTGNTNTLQGVTTTWSGLDLSNKPNWNIVVPGNSFQFTESYQAPGLVNQTIIQRETEIRSVTDTTSVFSN
jgi:hypothetical protein